MTDQKRQRLMFALLVFSVLFGLYMKPWERRAKPTAPEQSAAATTEIAPVTAEPQPSEIAYASAWPERDPFTRSEEYRRQGVVTVAEDVSVGTPSFVVQGVMTVNGQMVCVIDGQTRAVGSHFSGWRLDKIDAQGVWVSQGGERHFVPLP
jgi:hypothetical protein